jgi:hypothetical protein
LAEDPPRASLLAGAVQPWRLGGGAIAKDIEDIDGFVAFDTPGWAKVTMDFRLRAEGTATLLSSEIRVLGTDTRARRAFAAYWWIGVRPMGGVLRRAILRKVALSAVG